MPIECRSTTYFIGDPDILSKTCSVSQEQILSFDQLIQTSNCEVDQSNDTFTRKFLRDSVGPNLRSSIDRDLPMECSGARMLYFIIRKLRVVSATSGRNLVDKIKVMRLTSEPAYNAQDFGMKLHNSCVKLEGLGEKFVPDDLPMLLACCYDTTNVAPFDLAVIQIQNELDEDPAKYKWQDIIIHFGRKYDTLVGNERWPPLQSGGKAAETGFPVQLKRGNTHAISVLQSQIATLNQALTKAQGNGVAAHGHATECHYCHESGHVVATCPKLATKKAKQDATPPHSQPCGGEDTKHWTKEPPAEGEPLTKTLLVEGTQVTYKFCAQCRRWRAGDKAHTTEEHRTRAELSDASTMQSPNNQGNLGSVSGLGLSFGLGGLFVGSTDLSTDHPLLGDTDTFLQDI
jgi:hypothetical protein